MPARLPIFSLMMVIASAAGARDPDLIPRNFQMSRQLNSGWLAGEVSNVYVTKQGEVVAVNCDAAYDPGTRQRFDVMVIAKDPAFATMSGQKISDTIQKDPDLASLLTLEQKDTWLDQHQKFSATDYIADEETRKALIKKRGIERYEFTSANACQNMAGECDTDNKMLTLKVDKNNVARSWTCPKTQIPGGAGASGSSTNTGGAQ